MRFILVTKERGAALDAANTGLLGDQAGSCLDVQHVVQLYMFNTSFSYKVLEKFEQLADELDPEVIDDVDPAVRFDKLLGFTRAISEHDAWMEDHEVGWEGPEMLGELADMWKETLAESDAALKIDAEFTRPGVECFLDMFKKRVEEIDEDYDECEPTTFDWR